MRKTYQPQLVNTSQDIAGLFSSLKSLPNAEAVKPSMSKAPCSTDSCRVRVLVRPTTVGSAQNS